MLFTDLSENRNGEACQIKLVYYMFFFGIIKQHTTINLQDKKIILVYNSRELESFTISKT